ncbi:hypothetical protein GWK47_042007 [Chionoecetes opilio]|uniref:Uncharacterized protein n=1 Tax=Chionoecetes opilio TaxID=41210 RepID=A0A8J5CWW7_CHIOP|nr:hypothetical protein GWK47_042007 [Chionoecetes opilio]
MVDLFSGEEAARDGVPGLGECVPKTAGLTKRTGSRSPPARLQERGHLSCQGENFLYTCDRNPRLSYLGPEGAVLRTFMRGTRAGLKATRARDQSTGRVYAEGEQKRRQWAGCNTHAPSSPAETLLPPPPPQTPFPK